MRVRLDRCGQSALGAAFALVVALAAASAFVAIGVSLDVALVGSSAPSHQIVATPDLASSQQAGVFRSLSALVSKFDEPLGGLLLPPVAKSVESHPDVARRFKVPPGARARFGEDLDLIASGLMQGDPEADALVRLYQGRNQELYQIVREAMETGMTPEGAPEELVRFLSRHQQVPDWVDFEQLDRGGEVMVRGGIHGLSALFFQSLAAPYLSPSGVKPLVATTELLDVDTAFRRMMTTQRYVNAVCEPGGLCPGGAGFLQTPYVRLGHAAERAKLLAAGFDTAQHGVPINQSDMAGTALAFSVAYLDAMRRMGFTYTKEEADAVVALWRYSGYLNGVDLARTFVGEADAQRYAAATISTQGVPSGDSVALIATLSEVRGVLPSFGGRLASLNRLVDGAIGPTTQGVLRLFLGDEYADLAGLPKRRVGLAATLLRSSAKAAQFAPEGVSVRAGRAVWNQIVEQGLRGESEVRAMPGGKALLGK